MADEPTGNLDGQTATVSELLQGLVKQGGLGALVATHNLELAGRMDRILRLENGLDRRLVPNIDDFDFHYAGGVFKLITSPTRDL